MTKLNFSDLTFSESLGYPDRGTREEQDAYLAKIEKQKRTPLVSVSSNGVDRINNSLKDVHLAVSQVSQAVYTNGAINNLDPSLAALEEAVKRARAVLTAELRS